MFKKVLIANRGEIAVRVSRTLRDLGVKVVAVYSEADREAPHVLGADEAYLLGSGPVSESYLNVERIMEVIAESGAEAVHPGYGLLSENAVFAERIEAAGCVWLGPTGESMRKFGLKHTARDLAVAAEVPLCPGTGLVASLEEALSEAEGIGFPLMLKSTAGGGGIGMEVCRSVDELKAAFEKVVRLAKSNFGEAGVFLERFVERARHIEVQIFGDGEGKVLALGERDCSAQRRNQKVVEETPAPGLTDEMREGLFAAAVRLGKSLAYRSAGTVEFLFDKDREEFYFLEVNTRLQVEHGVTELVTGVDLVEWMVRLGAGDNPIAAIDKIAVKGVAMEVRVYAEDAAKNFLPSAGLITEVKYPEGVRCDGWIAAGTEVSTFYDPLLVKIQVKGESREETLTKMADALEVTKIGGIRTNLDYLAHIISSEPFKVGGVGTKWLDTLEFSPRIVEVLRGGTMTTVQDWPGRLGYWDVGVPPSGPMDSLSFRLANQLVGNDKDAAALECTMAGPGLKFGFDTQIALTGADMGATLGGVAVKNGKAISVAKGQVLELGKGTDGCRTYLAISGGIDVPDYLGSKSTFTLGKFGGHGGRALVAGDVLEIQLSTFKSQTSNKREELCFEGNWEIGVLYGPHGSPDFFTEEDIETFFTTEWEVHFNSARTGVRLIGPKPKWARKDGGEAGLHPSNIHDNAYAVGAVDFTGDMPVILGPDGPSLGGFVCPVTIIEAELWKVGQLKPGDKVRFNPVGLEVARMQAALVEDWLENGGDYPILNEGASEEVVVARGAVQGEEVVIRRAGDEYVLLEVGEMILDLRLRFLVHLLYEWLREELRNGFVDVTPGIRSLQVHYDPWKTSEAEVVALLLGGLEKLPALEDAEVESRVVHLPLAWDDPSTQLAIERYMKGVNPNAPWCPSNIEFIRRINGLDSIEQVKEIVYSTEYLVMGLGDVYLGAPVATPLDPRHRLVTTKYNPARTWTPENAVGIGGAYLCIYGMEGPGGYQFVGRTTPIWNKYRETEVFTERWLLRFFDRLRWEEVSPEKLLDLRREILTGEFVPEIVTERFKLGDYLRFLEEEKDSIADFRAHQRQAFADERQRWEEAGLNLAEMEEAVAESVEIELPEGCEFVESPMMGSVWRVEVEAGEAVAEGATGLILEAMKMEMTVPITKAGTIFEVLVAPGAMVKAGDPLLILKTGK
ncbi:MAG: urea carboxylase [Akkermansiaceae bacterium]|jgi:urea carboxylase|nr:urea carboxylase [Akkermansiaceae bacterium]MDP4995164.1 urea carboxylase [Akkermansiaceae bacterium]